MNFRKSWAGRRAEIMEDGTAAVLKERCENINDTVPLTYWYSSYDIHLPRGLTCCTRIHNVSYPQIGVITVLQRWNSQKSS